MDGKLMVSILALIASVTAIVMSWRTATQLKQRDIQIDKRKLFITTLWDKLTAVRGLNATNVTQERLLEVLNTLELVAVCWDADIVDRDLVVRAFGASYNERVDEIKRIVPGTDYNEDKINSLGGTGPTYLRIYGNVEKVAQEIKEHKLEGINQ
jgi:hypothetical protein